MDQSEDEFGAFDQFDPFEGPSGDLGDPSLMEADLQGTSSQTDMGFKRKPSASLQDLLEGQSGKDVLGNHSLNFPLLLPNPNPLRPGRRLPYRNQLNPSPPFNMLTPRGRGLPKGKTLWTGGDPALLRRRTRVGELRSN